MDTSDEIRTIARLARLEIDEAEAVQLARDFQSILNYIAKLEGVDVHEVEPMSHVHGVTNVFRDDLVEPGVDPGCLMEIVPKRAENFVQVPIIIDQL